MAAPALLPDVATSLFRSGLERKTTVSNRLGGGRMIDPAYPSTRHDYPGDAEEIERLEAAMDAAPAGAVAVSAIAVALLLIGWLWVYFFIFLPRGTVG